MFILVLFFRQHQCIVRGGEIRIDEAPGAPLSVSQQSWRSECHTYVSSVFGQTRVMRRKSAGGRAVTRMMGNSSVIYRILRRRSSCS